MSDLFIGLMSGTSVDGIDAAVVDFNHPRPKLIATDYTPYSPVLRDQILALCYPGENEIERMGELDVILGKAFAAAVNQLLDKHHIARENISAIGSHGQTIRHRPYPPHKFTLQIGDPNTIAAETGITTIADFRRKDMAHGGQGAPLVPAFHQHILASDTINRAVVNIGGIANITLLPKKMEKPLQGYDVGPGNVLLDAWIQENLQKTHDHLGQWGANGNVHEHLLQQLLSDDFFHQPPPKSTGRERFNLPWLSSQLQSIGIPLAPVDVQATLADLTAHCILNEIRRHLPDGEILICGGGTQNTHLMTRLQTLAAPHFTVDSTEKYGLDPNWIEAMAFAWLAKQTLNHQPGNLPSVTGASQLAILGGVYFI